MRMIRASGTATALAVGAFACAGSATAFEGVVVNPVGVVPIRTAIVAPNGAVKVAVSCSAACVGSLSLTALLPVDKPRAQTTRIAGPKDFRIKPARGGSTTVKLRLTTAGLKAVKHVGTTDLAVMAVMKYAAAPHKPAETDRYAMILCYRSCSAGS